MSIGSNHSRVGLGTMILDLFESLLLLPFLTLIAPFKVIGALFHPRRTVEAAGILLPQGLAAMFLRATIDRFLRRFERSLMTSEILLAQLEEKVFPASLKPSQFRLVASMYAAVVRMHLQVGQIEDSSLMVIRAHKFLGVEKLPGLSDFDVKTAHIVKAGIAACKMLEEGGQATLLLTAPNRQTSRPQNFLRSKRGRDSFVKSNGAMGKVIPFHSSREKNNQHT